MKVSIIFLVMLVIAVGRGASAAQVNVGCLLYYGAMGKAMHELANSFMSEHPQISIIVRDFGDNGAATNSGCPASASSTDDVLLGAIGSDAVGDIGTVTATEATIVAARSIAGPNGALLGLNRQFVLPVDEASKSVPALSLILQQLPPEVIRLVTNNGHVWAIPFAISDMLVYGVRRDIFANAGLAVDPNWDWDDFLLDAKKAASVIASTNRGVKRARFGILVPDGQRVDFWHALLLGNSSSVIDASGNGHLESPDNIETLRTVGTWFRSAAVGYDTTEASPSDHLLLNGFVAGEWIDASEYLTARGRSGSGGDPRMANRRLVVPLPLPHAPGHSSPPIPVDMIAWVLSSSIPSQSVAPAAQFLTWLSGNGASLYASSGLLPLDPVMGRTIFSGDARSNADFYYTHISLARIFGHGYSEPVWTRFTEKFPLFANGNLSAAEFAQWVDHG